MSGQFDLCIGMGSLCILIYILLVCHTYQLYLNWEVNVFKDIFVLKAGFMFVFLNSFVTCRVSFPTEVNTAHFLF
jgi:hypothetical protein